MRTLRADVAIAGGGLAGSTLAALLASRGLEVTVIEKDEFPRDKLCGEFLSWDANPVLDLLDLGQTLDASGARSIDRCTVHAGSSRYEFALPGTARGISRSTLDATIAKGALDAGATLLTRAVVKRIEPSTSSPFLLFRKDDEDCRLDAKLIVGAWGRWGRIDKQLQRPWTDDRRHRYFGFKRHYRSSQTYDDRIDIYSFGSGYLGVSPVEGGLTNICGLVHESRMTGMKDRWHGMVDQISEESDSFGSRMATMTPEDEEFMSSEPVIFRARTPSHAGALMVGDTAGIVDPLAGNGMAMAMQSSLLAATLILDYLRRRGDRKTLLRRYDREFGKLFHPRIRWSRSVAAILTRPAALRAVTSLPLPPGLGRLLASKTRGRMDEIGLLADNFLARL